MHLASYVDAQGEGWAAVGVLAMEMVLIGGSNELGAFESGVTGAIFGPAIAVVIGGASLAGGKGRAFGTLIGALVLAVIRNGLNLLNVSSFWQQVVIGIVIALAVLTDTLRRKSA